MLTLSLNANQIPLAPDFSMDLVWKNPACFFDKIPGAYGLSISLPINDFTRSLFGNPQRFAKYRVEKDQQFPGFEVRFGGVLLMAGTLSITNAANGSYEASLIDQLGVLGEEETERNILDFPVFNQQIPWINCNNYAPGTHKYCCFPIQNAEFFKDKGVRVKRTVIVPDTDRNWWQEFWGTGKTREIDYETEAINFLYNKSVNARVNALRPDLSIKQLDSLIDLKILRQKNNTYESGQVSVITPFFYLNWVIAEALKTSGFHITDSILSQDSSLKKLVIYNNFDIMDLAFEMEEMFLMITTPIGSVAEFNQIDYTKSLGKELIAYIRNSPETVKPKNHLPKIKLGSLLLSTQNLLNTCFHFLPNKTVKVYSREKLITDQAFDLNSFFTGAWDIGSKESVTLNFIREPDKNDLIFAERFVDLDERRADIKEPLSNWANLQLDLDQSTIQVGDIHYLSIPGVFVEYKWLTETKVDPQTKEETTRDFRGWTELSIGLQNGWYQYGKEKVEEIKTAWAPVFGMSDTLPAFAIVRQKGNTEAWKDAKIEFAPRLLIQHLGTSGAHESVDLSFEYEKPLIGILPKYWKNWNCFWANRLPVSAEFDLPVNVLRYVIENICQKYRTREGEFIIEEMRTSISVNAIKATQIKGFKG